MSTIAFNRKTNMNRYKECVTFNDSNVNKHTFLYINRVEQNNIDDLSGMTEGSELRILR